MELCPPVLEDYIWGGRSPERLGRCAPQCVKTLPSAFATKTAFHPFVLLSLLSIETCTRG